MKPDHSTQRTLIIAEAGVNHNGNLQTALKLIDAAAESGADYVKFQTFRARNLVTKDAEKASYQTVNLQDTHISQYEMLKKLELSYDDHYVLKSHAESAGIRFMSTGFDNESIDFLEKLKMDFYKIPSGEITNYPYLKHIASKGIPVILSTGMTTLGEIERAINVFLTAGIKKSDISILHCNTEYPTPMKDVNLHAMLTLKAAFGVRTGYSDHTLGIEVPIAAVAMGAEIIEKHFTLDTSMSGPDHKASLNPEELKQMVLAIRNIELATSGDGMKYPSSSEQKNIEVARKSIHTLHVIRKGHFITEGDLVMLRPGDGISPFDLDKIIGRKATTDIGAYTKVTWRSLE